jgi:uncharacterized protein YdhG (YjbR/CyaY superfamily)
VGDCFAPFHSARNDIIKPMQSTAKDVTTYIEQTPTERREALLKLRALCQNYLTDFTESMAYSGPSYSRNGEVEVGFASQKHFIGLYILRTDVMKTHIDQLKGKGVSIGKGAIRYSKPGRIDFKVVESMLRATQESIGKVC